MSKRFERLGSKVEGAVIGAVLVILAIAYLVSRISA